MSPTHHLSFFPLHCPTLLFLFFLSISLLSVNPFSLLNSFQLHFLPPHILFPPSWYFKQWLLTFLADAASSSLLALMFPSLLLFFSLYFGPSRTPRLSLSHSSVSPASQEEDHCLSLWTHSRLKSFCLIPNVLGASLPWRRVLFPFLAPPLRLLRETVPAH